MAQIIEKYFAKRRILLKQKPVYVAVILVSLFIAVVALFLTRKTEFREQ